MDQDSPEILESLNVTLQSLVGKMVAAVEKNFLKLSNCTSPKK
jgi:hypothetical protein